ncbi:hypothetical protein NMD1_03008 [Novosphingobium sp. MD-1]|nr:hypothetical protein NMD1_03008 [Novosphingobium sp. MD-1]
MDDLSSALLAGEAFRGGHGLAETNHDVPTGEMPGLPKLIG